MAGAGTASASSMTNTGPPMPGSLTSRVEHPNR